MKHRTLSTPRRLTLAIALLALAAASAGCAGGRGASRSPYAANGEQQRDPQRARELYAEAVRVGPGDPVEAERLLRAALAADIYLGPAHNNLGALLLERGLLYEAANEFEWARKLMPGHPSPRVNLAMTLERAGKTDLALEAYDAALAVYDGHLPAIQGKARLQVLAGRADRETVAALEEIALRGDEEWRRWALLWKSKLAERAW